MVTPVSILNNGFYHNYFVDCFWNKMKYDNFVDDIVIAMTYHIINSLELWPPLSPTWKTSQCTPTAWAACGLRSLTVIDFSL